MSFFLTPSYPLPTDVIVRTLTLDTREFIAPLIECLQPASREALSKGIDALCPKVLLTIDKERRKVHSSKGGGFDHLKVHSFMRSFFK